MWYSEILYQHSEIRKTQPTVPASSKMTSSRFCQVSVRLPPRPPWSIHSGVVSEKNERRTHFFTRILFQKFSVSWDAERKTTNEKVGEMRVEKELLRIFWLTIFSRCAPRKRLFRSHHMTLEGLVQARYREYKGRKPTQRRTFFDGVLHSGWPNQPSADAIGISHKDVFL